MSDSTRHHDAVALGRLQKFALEHKLLDQPVFGNLEKPRVGRRDRVPTAAETEAILAKASPAFRLIYSTLRQCGARPGGPQDRAISTEIIAPAIPPQYNRGHGR